MKWTEHREPNSEIPYDHIIAETPLGRVTIEWKGWKAYPSYTVYIGEYGDYIGNVFTLDAAKDVALKYLKDKSEELNKYLENG